MIVRNDSRPVDDDPRNDVARVMQPIDPAQTEPRNAWGSVVDAVSVFDLFALVARLFGGR